jgi:hypothetical protein
MVFAVVSNCGVHYGTGQKMASLNGDSIENALMVSV